MRLSRRKILAGLGAAGLTGCGGEDTARLFYSSEFHPSDYPTVHAVNHMSDLLKARTGGRLGVKVYAGGQLGSERDTLEITIFGGLDMNRVNAAPLNAIAPMTIVPCLPFVFRTEEHMRAALDGAPGRAVLNSLEPHGIVGLCFYDSGARSFYSTRGPIRTPADMNGMKIRVQNSDLYVSMIAALGADATPMPLGDVYQGLVQGVIDAAENNWPSYESGRHFEVAPHYSLTRHVMAPEVLVMSRHRWRTLSDDDKALVLDCAAQSVPVMRALWDERVAKARATVLAAGVQVNEVDDITAFSARMGPIWDRFATSPAQKRLVEDIVTMASGV